MNRTTLLEFAFLILALAVAAPRTVRANEAPAALQLTLPEARARAARVAPGVRLAESHVREAEATRVGAAVRLPANPRVSLDVRPGLDRDSRGSLGQAGGIDLLFDAPGARGARLIEADARTQVAQADGAVARLDARLAALELYVGARLAAVSMKHATDSIALAERVLGAARERNAAGAGSDIDVTSAQVELSSARALLADATAARHRNEMELRYLIELDAGTALHLSTPVETPASAPPIATLVAEAQQRRPDLAAIEARLAYLTAADDRLRKEARPKLGAFGGLDHSPQSPLFGIVGLSVELPLAQRNQGPRAVVAAERQTELDRLALAKRRIDVALRSARGAYEARLQGLTTITNEGIPAAEARLALVETGWRAGRFDIFKLTTAATDLVRLKAARVELLQQIWQDRVLLERLMGGWTDDRS